jgi:hypothetical protein
MEKGNMEGACRKNNKKELAGSGLRSPEVMFGGQERLFIKN